MLLSELTELLGDLTLKISNNQAVVQARYGQDTSELDFELRKMILDYFVLSSYNMNWDGSVTGQTNYLTEAEFTDFFGRVQQYASY